MDDKDYLTPLAEGLAALVAWLDAEEVPYVLIGGIAASFFGRPRITRDLDVLASLDEPAWGAFVESGRSKGFVPRISDCVEFARVSRVLLLRHMSSSVDADVVLAGLPYEESTIRGGATVHMAGIALRLVRPEDLIVMKAVAQRPRDIGDIEGILDTHAVLDWDHILKHTREFAEVLGASDIVRTVETLRQRHRTTHDQRSR